MTGPALLVFLLVVTLVTTGVAAALGGHTSGRATSVPVLSATLRNSSSPAVPAACVARPGEYTPSYPRAVYRQVFPIFETAGQDISPGAHEVDLGLNTGQEEIASLVEDHFGTAVLVSVGGSVYCHGPGPRPACPAPPTGRPLPAGLHLSLKLESTDINAISSDSGHLTVRWTGAGTFSIDTGQPLLAETFARGTLHPVGVYTGPVAGTGQRIDLRHDQSTRVAVFVGTNRCGSGRGSALPAKSYEERVLLTSEVPSKARSYLSPPVPLTVNGP